MSFSQYLSFNSGGESEGRGEWTGQNSKVRSLIQKLQALDCPYLEGMDEAVISDVIFTPGEARLRVLTWLTARLHPSLKREGNIATIPRLAALLQDVGLCSKEDHELVKGDISAGRQLQLWEALADLVTMKGWRNEDEKLQSFPWYAERCCHFVDDLCRHNDLGVAFPSSVSLVPPGIAGSRGVARPQSHDPKRPMPPSLSELNKRCEELRSLLEEKQVQLEAELQTHTYVEVQPDALENCHKMMAVSLGMLAQLCVSFCHTYEAEIQPWCNRQAPPFTPLGPLCKRVHALKMELDKEDEICIVEHYSPTMADLSHQLIIKVVTQ